MSQDLVDSALAQVVRWEDVPASWAGHRTEPLAAQRLWACEAEGPSERERRAETARRAGFDADGRVVIVGPAESPTPPSALVPWVDVVVRSESEVAVHGLNRIAPLVAVTTFDASGRAVRTTYGDASPDETYAYDSEGKLVVIDESLGLETMTRPLRSLTRGGEIGGRLEVRHDDRGPAAIVADRDGTVVWERVDVPWPEALAALAAPMVEAVVEAVAALALPVATEAHALVLDTVSAAWPEVDATVIVGTVAARERTLVELSDDAFSREEALWLPGDPYDKDRVTGARITDAAAEQAAIRVTAMHAAGDPRRHVLQAAVEALARHDWSALFTPTPDFVVYLSGDDDGWIDMYNSMVAANPPERIEARRERWRGSPFPPAAD